MNITKNTEDVRQFFAKMRKENLARIALHVAPVLPTDIRSTVSRYIAGETDTIDDETTRIALSFLTWRSVVCEAELIKHAEQNSKRELTFHEKEMRISTARVTFTGAVGTMTILESYFPTSIKRMTPYIKYLDVKRMVHPDEYRKWLDDELLKAPAE